MSADGMRTMDLTGADASLFLLQACDWKPDENVVAHMLHIIWNAQQLLSWTFTGDLAQTTEATQKMN